MHLSDALRRAGGLKPDSYLGQVLVARLRGDSTRTMLHTALSDTTGRASRRSDARRRRRDHGVFDDDVSSEPLHHDCRRRANARSDSVSRRHDDSRRGAARRRTAGGRVAQRRRSRATSGESRGRCDGRHTARRARLDVSVRATRGRTSSRTAGSRGAAARWRRRSRSSRTTPCSSSVNRSGSCSKRSSSPGEVKFPGRLLVDEQDANVCRTSSRTRAGLTTSAYPDGIVFVRKHGGVGRIGVDLSAVLRDPRNVDNLALFDGDSIYIPRYAPVVTVRGAVNSQVGVAYVAGANIDYYIRAAGGENAQGDAGRAYVTQGNGKVESRHRHLAAVELAAGSAAGQHRRRSDEGSEQPPRLGYGRDRGDVDPRPARHDIRYSETLITLRDSDRPASACVSRAPANRARRRCRPHRPPPSSRLRSPCARQ